MGRTIAIALAVSCSACSLLFPFEQEGVGPDGDADSDSDSDSDSDADSDADSDSDSDTDADADGDGDLDCEPVPHADVSLANTTALDVQGNVLAVAQAGSVAFFGLDVFGELGAAPIGGLESAPPALALFGFADGVQSWMPGTSASLVVAHLVAGTNEARPLGSFDLAQGSDLVRTGDDQIWLGTRGNGDNAISCLQAGADVNEMPARCEGVQASTVADCAVRALAANAATIFAACFGDDTGTIRAHPLNAGVDSTMVEGAEVMDLAASGNHLVVLSDRALSVWALPDEAILATRVADSSVVYERDGFFLALGAGGVDGLVPSTGEVTGTIGVLGTANAVALDGDHELVYVAGSNGVSVFPFDCLSPPPPDDGL